MTPSEVRQLPVSGEVLSSDVMSILNAEGFIWSCILECMTFPNVCLVAEPFRAIATKALLGNLFWLRFLLSGF